MGKTSTKYKDKYNENAYARYTIRIRKDDCLYCDVVDFMSRRGTSLNFLVTKLLEIHFNQLPNSDPEYPL
jgi:hypothetical protein